MLLLIFSMFSCRFLPPISPKSEFWNVIWPLLSQTTAVFTMVIVWLSSIFGEKPSNFFGILWKQTILFQTAKHMIRVLV